MHWLEQLFKEQIKSLYGVDRKIVEALAVQKNDVLEKASKIYKPPSFFNDKKDDEKIEIAAPFLPVIPVTSMEVKLLMKLVNCDYTFGGYNNLMKPAELKDTIQTPSTAYYIYDVKLKCNTMGRSPQSGKALTESESRRVLTVTEAIALCTHTLILPRCFLFASGSHYQCEEWIPDINVGPNGPRLTWKYILEHQLKEWGTPSCMK